MDSAQVHKLAPIIEDLSQSEKLSEIKPPLGLVTVKLVLLLVNAINHDNQGPKLFTVSNNYNSILFGLYLR